MKGFSGEIAINNEISWIQKWQRQWISFITPTGLKLMVRFNYLQIAQLLSRLRHSLCSSSYSNLANFSTPQLRLIWCRIKAMIRSCANLDHRSTDLNTVIIWLSYNWIFSCLHLRKLKPHVWKFADSSLRHSLKIRKWRN